MKTIEDAKQWVAENHKELTKTRLSSTEPTIQMLNRVLPDKSRDLWDSGCWLQNEMRTLGATNEEITDAQFACGQRAFANDPWEIAVRYINEYQESGEIKDKPGAQLGEEINKELFGEI